MANLAETHRQATSRPAGPVGWEVRRREVGHVVRVGDGVAYLRGMPSVKYGELLECRDGLSALAFDLRPNEVGAPVPRPGGQGRGGRRSPPHRPRGERAGRRRIARPRHRSARQPARWQLDRFVRTPIWPVEREAPGVADRQPVTEPLLTGTKVIDALLPIGRGQRELILGDRATGKTTIALDAILAQRGTGVKCVYASIGERKAALAEVVDALAARGALEYTAVVAATADAAPGLQYLAPFAACTIGEYFMHQRRPRAGRLRRPDQARRRLPPRVPAARPPARARSVSRRCVLPARPAARTRHETARPARRRKPDRASHRRHAGRERRGLYPDQPDLDHRRADLPERPALQRGPAAGGRCGLERVAGRREGPAAGAAARRRRSEAALLAARRSWSRSPASVPNSSRRRGSGWSAAGGSARSSSRAHMPRAGLDCWWPRLFAVREGLFDTVPVDADRPLP